VWQSLTAGTQHYFAGQENPYAQHWRIGNNTDPIVQDMVTASILLIELYEFKVHLQNQWRRQQQLAPDDQRLNMDLFAQAAA
jgi:hypothetical protein